MNIDAKVKLMLTGNNLQAFILGLDVMPSHPTHDGANDVYRIEQHNDKALVLYFMYRTTEYMKENIIEYFTEMGVATDKAERIIRSYGYRTDRLPIDCVDNKSRDLALVVENNVQYNWDNIPTSNITG